MISNAQWNNYINVINNFSDNVNKEVVIWEKLSYNFSRYGEDDYEKNYEQIELECLISYNIFRTWPITKNTKSGDLDEENIVMILNASYLDNLGYLNNDGYLDFDPGNDKFYHMGKEYRAYGDTPVSQAKDNPLLIYVILKRQQKINE